MRVSVRGADVSIKPGASAPGLRARMITEPAKRAIALTLKIGSCDSPANRSAGLVYSCTRDPGANAPGFMLTSASRTRRGQPYTAVLYLALLSAIQSFCSITASKAWVAPSAYVSIYSRFTRHY